MNKNHPIPNTECLVIACRELGIYYKFYDNNCNLIGVKLDREYFFANSSTPFNDESSSKVFKDKEFAYRVTRDLIKTPRTVGFIDPLCNPDYRAYVKFHTHAEIMDEIEGNFSYPLMIKMNSGSRGINIFKCESRQKALESIACIFDKNSLKYDYVALAQEYIDIKKEFRVIVFQKNIMFMYEKDFSKSTHIDGNISPLHQDNAKAVLIKDVNLISQISDFISPLFKSMEIGFVGLDIAIDRNGKFWLIEINSKPGFEYFVRDNGKEELIKMYGIMLKHLKS